MHTKLSSLRPRNFTWASTLAFTLFEVAISLVIIAFGVVSVLMLIPSGVKAQQFARFQILASARAIELIDAFSNASGGNQLTDREGIFPWDTATSYRAFAPDLETATGSGRYGLIPLPVEIARRLDSDNDEIQNILNEGGYVYYSNPLATSHVNQNAVASQIPQPNETRKIICAVVGYAQQNAIPAFSYKDWPYYTPYPSPPVHVQGGSTILKTSLPDSPYSVLGTERKSDGVNGNADALMLWENTLDADQGEMGLVFRAVVKGNDSNLPGTTKWVEACEPGGVLEKATNHLGYFYFRDSGYLACCDQFGWIPEPYLTNLPQGYNWRRTPKWTPGSYTAKWEWYQNGADTSKNYDATSTGKISGDAAKDMTQEMRDYIQPLKLRDHSKAPTDPDYEFDNPVAGMSTKELAKEAALAYFALALWYAQEKGVSSAIRDGMPLADDANLLAPSTLYSSSSSTTSPALAVNAARILAHAAMVLSKHLENDMSGSLGLGECEIYREGTYPFTVGYSQTSDGYPTPPSSRPLLTRVSAGTPGINTDKTPAFSGVDLTKIKIYFDNAMRLGMRFAATFPYDWGSPRPMKRAIMMDNALLQYDMFNSSLITEASIKSQIPFSGYAYGMRPTSTRYGYSSTKAAEQWRIASAQPIVNIGRSQCYPSMNLSALLSSIATDQSPGQRDAGGHPNAKHFTLARPFTTEERTRELVFWAVDWQSYEDFETAPSAPVDASRFPKIAPANYSTSRQTYGTLAANQTGAPNVTRSFRTRFYDRIQPETRNPEKVLCFIGPTDEIPSGYDQMYLNGVDSSLTTDNSVKPDHFGYRSIFSTSQITGAGLPPVPPKSPEKVFSGQFGADRNADNLRIINDGGRPDWVLGFFGKLDRGPVPKSVRMRATQIARFNFYDPRLPLVIK